MEPGKIHLYYIHYDRFIAGGAVPVDKTLALDAIDPLKSDFFLERRELGIINLGGKGTVQTDSGTYELSFLEALYIGKGIKKVNFTSNDDDYPAKFYLNSAPAHKAYPAKKVGKDESNVVEAGDPSTSNARSIIKLIDGSILEVCQLQMGITILKPGNVWNTMPCHTHDRRMEVYFYYGMNPAHAVSHFMGPAQETRHIWVQNEQAVISPPWSIHCGSGTGHYSFVWGMAGENLDYTDMDGIRITEMR